MAQEGKCVKWKVEMKSFRELDDARFRSFEAVVSTSSYSLSFDGVATVGFWKEPPAISICIRIG
jgi:hypothetical protein